MTVTAHSAIPQAVLLAPAFAKLRFVMQSPKKSLRLMQPIVVALATSDRNPIVRHESAFALGELADPFSISVLGKCLKNDPEPIVRHEAAFALAFTHSPEALFLLLETIQDSSKIVRETVEIAIHNLIFDLGRNLSHSLKSLKLKKNINSYIKFMASPAGALAPFMRIRSINQLRKKREIKSVLKLVKFLKEDDNSIVRHEAAYSLGELGYELAICYLIESLKSDPDAIVRHEAAFALGIMAKPAALKAIKSVKPDKSKIVRDTVQIAIDNLQYDLDSSRPDHVFS